MRRIGVYHVPFPYDPYPLQVDAVDKLSHFLREEVDPISCHEPDASEAEGSSGVCSAEGEKQKEKRAVKHPRDADGEHTARAARAPAVAVLESPTGTGKSQMLLNAVLAAVFDVVTPPSGVVPGEDSGHRSLDESSSHTQPGAVTAETGTTEPAPLSLEAVVAAQRLADEMQRVRHARRQRVRAERRRLRLAHQYMTQYLNAEKRHAISVTPLVAGDHTAAADPLEMLIEQDPIQFLREHAPGMYDAFVSEVDGGGSHGAALFSSSSESDFSDASADDGREGRDVTARRRHARGRDKRTSHVNKEADDAEDAGDEDTIAQHLATLVPLRVPKVYFASRTHTQLDQLRGDFEKTHFAHALVRTRAALCGQESAGRVDAVAAYAPAPHRLRAVHVASRQQLCINQRVRAEAARRGGVSAEALNEACLEAIRYEYSPAGRAARLKATQHGSPVHVMSEFSGIYPGSSGEAGLVDLEDMATSTTARGEEEGDDRGSARGCVFCGEKRLRALIEYIQSQRTCASPPSDAPSPHTPEARLGGGASVSLEVMQKLGRELQACPYLATRLLVRGADILFIPYGYLVDEAQRESLLRGVATNPATEDEEIRFREHVQMSRHDRHCHETGEGRDVRFVEDEAGSASGRTALGAVLYRRRRVREAGSRFGRGGHGSGKAASASSSIIVSARDDECRVTALNAGPHFGGATLVFDEAHNLADHCRTTSTTSVSATDLSLTRALLHAYLARYEKRLLISSKQRIRELMLFLDGLFRGATRALTHKFTVVQPFTTFLFDAGVDHVDVFAFLAFLVDSRLFVKMPGMVSYVLQQVQAEAHANAAANARAAAVAHYKPSTTHARVRRTLPAPSPTSPAEVITTTTSSQDRGALPDDGTAAASLPVLFAELLARSPSVGSVSDVHTMWGPGHPLPIATCASLAVGALRRVEQLLRWFYLSDDSTRVLLMRDAHFDARFTVKLLQLRPAVHTLWPVLCAARATILAGGTMQPLQLTCAPLLDVPGGVFAPRPISVRFIQEGHVVPSSSVAVWALGTGPSGMRLNLRAHAHSADSGECTSTEAADVLLRGGGGSVFAELALTLLNVARVMPPAGLVCFFTSFDLEARFTAFLHTHAALYWDPLNAVKKVFREGSLREPRDGGGEKTIEHLMQDYREWIHGSTKAGTGSGAPRGAILFAVMGGRLSEGINFADELGRCVMVIGMPFANPADPELQLYLRHMATASTRVSTIVGAGDEEGTGGGPTGVADEQDRRREEDHHPVGKQARQEVRLSASVSSSGADTGQSRLDVPFSPQEWSLYTDMCMRVVNQSIGRCIRHAKDYAAVILVDERYVERRDVRRRVSQWLQSSIAVASGGFPQCIRGIKQFFDAHTKDPAL